MRRFSLRLAFFALGASCVVPRVADAFGVEASQTYVLAMCLPAVLFGCTSYWTVRSFARSWPVVVCVAIAWAGLLYGTGRTNHRGHLNVGYLSIVLPIAALIVEQRCWWLCARMYVLGTVLAMGLAIWYDYMFTATGILRAVSRLGTLWNVEGTLRLANPNLLGHHLALAAVLALMFFLNEGAKRERKHASSSLTTRFGLAWTLLLSLGCALTASRGACAAWLGGTGVLLWGGTRSQRFGRLTDMVAIGAILTFAGIFLVMATGFQPWDTLRARLEDPANVLSASGRVPIWTAAAKIWLSSPRHFLVGLGTGLAPETLGAYMGYFLPDGVTPLSTDCHNAFVEWGLSFGLVGMIAGVCLLYSACHQARRLDRRDASSYRMAVLVCFGLASMTYVTVFQAYFVVAGPLLLAMLSEPATAVSPPKPAAHAAPAIRRPHMALRAQDRTLAPLIQEGSER